MARRGENIQEQQRWSLGGSVYLWLGRRTTRLSGVIFMGTPILLSSGELSPEKNAVFLLYIDCRGCILQRFGGQMVLFCAGKCKGIDCCALSLYAGSLYSSRAGQFFRPAADRDESRDLLAGNRICIPKASQTTGLHNGS